MTTIPATPANYQAVLTTLAPGQRMVLAPGIYPNGLSINGLNGSANACIVIEGPESGGAAVFTGRDCCNTVSLRSSSFVVIRNLELDGLGRAGDGVKAEFGSAYSHHVTIENLFIHGHGASQQIVGINTKSPAWNWVLRRNVIVGAGTGVYLGNSDGSQEFVNGLIEHNLIRDTIGYNLQIKHQNARNVTIGMPAEGTTIIRHNVFSKALNASTGGSARPNLLVGHWPLTGAGASDVYQIYGNFFYQNPGEALFQGEGNVALYDNVFVNDNNVPFPAVAIQPHNDVPRAIEIFHNTVVAAGAGISIVGRSTSFEQRVRANAVFASPAIIATNAFDNVTDLPGAAASYLVDPTAPPGAGLDLFPLAGALAGAPVDTTGLEGFLDWNRDFNGTVRSLIVRGAYTGSEPNPGWALDLDRKPEPTATPVTISIDDVSLAEGDVGSSAAKFTVSLSEVATQPISTEYATADVTATSGSDYEAMSGLLSFAPGSTARTILVEIQGDWVFEADELFDVVLSNAVGATLLDDRGEGLIVNDDAQGLSIADVTVREPSVGAIPAVFTITLAPTSSSTVSVDYQTVDDSATSPVDFQATSGTLSFSPGASSEVLTVTVLSDSADDGIERFFVDLTGSSGAPVSRARAVGTIFDPGAFFTVKPCRIIDTRLLVGPLAGPALEADKDRTFVLAGACGIPASAKAVSVNLAVTGATGPGNLRLHPGGTPVPLVSSINYAPGQTRSNNAVVPLDALGRVAVFASQSAGTVHLILDVNGYFQ